MIPFLVVGALGTAVGAVLAALTTHAAGEKNRQEASYQRKIANEILEKYRNVQKRYNKYCKANEQQIEDLKEKLSDSELEKDILYVAVRLQNALISQMHVLGKESSCEAMAKFREAVLQVNLVLAQINEDLVRIEASYFIENLRRIETNSLACNELASYYYLLGQIFHEDLEDYKEAILYYSKALETQPNKYKYWFSKGDTLVEIGRYKEALNDYSIAISIEVNNPNIWYSQSRIYRLLEDLQGEQKTLRFALALDSSYANTLYMMAVLLEKLNLKNQATECYTQVLEIEPDFADAYHRRGLIRLTLGDPLHALHQVYYRDAGRKDIEQARILYNKQGKKAPPLPKSSSNLIIGSILNAASGFSLFEPTLRIFN